MNDSRVAERSSLPSRLGRRKERDRRARQRRPLGVPPLRGLLPLAVGLVVWQLIGTPNSAYFPPPSSWWHAMHDSWQQDLLAPAIWSTAKTFLIALAAVVVIGSVLGWLVGRVRVVDQILGPLLEFLRVMPPAAIVPLAVLFGGYNSATKAVVVVMTAVWPVLLQVRSSSRTISPALLDTARALHLGRLETVRKITVPSLVPGLLVGVRVAAPIALISTLLVELLTAIPGVGALIETAQINFQAAAVFGLVAVAGMLGVLVSALLYLLEALLGRYTSSSQQ
jgi:ABC-type nitrate/sulfonate/bicarbonate transport system permease component